MGAGTAAKNYDGTNDYAKRGADLTGISDGKAGTFSCWVKFNGGDGSNQRIFSNEGTGGRGCFVNRNTSNKIVVRMRNASGTSILVLTSTGTYTASSGWTHIIAAWDLATPKGYLYINGSDDEAGGSTETDDTIDYTQGDVAIGAVEFNNGAKLNGCLAELWFDDVFYDITTSTVLDDWISGGAPVELGSDGSNPGAQPLIYAPNGDPSTNAGSGGNFTITGSLTDCSDAPASSGTTVAVGLASETDSAFAITDSQSGSIGMAIETDTATAIAYDVIITIGQASETDSAQAITINQGLNIGMALETDTAFPITDLQVVVMGQAVETDSAFAVTVSSADVVQVGQAVETDTAFGITDLQTVHIGQASETDTAWPLFPVMKPARVFYIARETTGRRVPVGFDGHLFDTEDYL